MDAKEQADRMAAAEALFMISTKKDKGYCESVPPRISKRGRKAKKPESGFEEHNSVSKYKNSYATTVLIDNEKLNKQERGHGGEQFVVEVTSTTGPHSQGMSIDKRYGQTSKFDEFSLDNKRKMKGILYPQLKQEVDLDLGPTNEMGTFSVSNDISTVKTTRRRGGKRGRPQNQSKTKTKSNDLSTGQSTYTHVSGDSDRNVGSKKGRTGPSTKQKHTPPQPSVDEWKFVSHGNNDDRSHIVRSYDTLKIKFPHMNPTRFGLSEESKQVQNKSLSLNNNDGQDISDDDLKTEVKALGFTGAAVTLYKAVSKGGKAIKTQSKIPTEVILLFTVQCNL